MKDSFILYTEQLEVIDKLTDEQVGKLFRTIKKYVLTGETDELDLITELAFKPIQQTIDKNNKKWEETREKRAEAGKKGMQSRWDKDNISITNYNKKDFVINEDNKNNKAIAKDNKNNKAILKITKITDNVNVNDNVHVHVNDNVDVDVDNNNINNNINKTTAKKSNDNSNSNKINEKNDLKESDSCVDGSHENDSCVDGFQEVINFYEANIGLLAPYVLEMLQDYARSMPNELLIYAMQKATEANIRTFKYIKGILNNWRKKGIKTLIQAKEETEKFKNRGVPKEETEEEKMARKIAELKGAGNDGS